MASESAGFRHVELANAGHQHLQNSPDAMRIVFGELEALAEEAAENAALEAEIKELDRLEDMANREQLATLVRQRLQQEGFGES